MGTARGDGDREVGFVRGVAVVGADSRGFVKAGLAHLWRGIFVIAADAESGRAALTTLFVYGVSTSTRMVARALTRRATWRRSGAMAAETFHLWRRSEAMAAGTFHL